MSSPTILNKSTHNIYSTQEALSNLRHARQKSKKQNPTSLFELVKSIYLLSKTQNNNIEKSKSTDPQMISSQDYLGTNRQTIEQMLLVIKNKIIETNNQNQNKVLSSQNFLTKTSNTEVVKSNCFEQNDPNPEEVSKTTEELRQSLKKKQEEISKLKLSLKALEQDSKNLQIKLLNNIKRLSVQAQQKDVQLNNLKSVLCEKQTQLEQLTKLNEKKHKRIRKLQEDVYDLQMQLQQKNQELKAEKQCADFLERKVAKILQNQAKTIKQEHQQDKISVITSKRTQIFEQSRFQHTMSQQIGIQTEKSHGNIIQGESQCKNQLQQQNSDNHSNCNSSTLTESKQTKYIQSIQRLTMELGQAYSKINQLIKAERSEQSQSERSIEIVSCQNLNNQEKNNDEGQVQQRFIRKKGKSKSKSGYFTNFWK